jgi:choline kinase
MQAIILLAGYGSRLNRDDLDHKCQLPFGEETLLSRQLDSLKKLGVTKTFLILGHNKDLLKRYALDLDLDMSLEFIENDLYASTGNTLSMVLGLQKISEDVLILDGDVFYPQKIFLDYAKHSTANSFAIVPTHIDDEECSKVLLKKEGTIAAFITKRLLTDEEKAKYQFAGEAIGFFKLSKDSADRFVAMYQQDESRLSKTLWEIPFSQFAQFVDIAPWPISEPGCFEIDTQEDYSKALTWSQNHPEA